MFCKHIIRDESAHIVWVDELCELEERYKYTVKAGTFVSGCKCDEYMEIKKSLPMSKPGKALRKKIK